MAIPKVIDKKRLRSLMVVLTLVFFILILRVVYLMIFEAPSLQQKALNQWTRELSVAPKRGTIYDRNMQVLAQSAHAYTVVARNNSIKDADYTAQKLSEILQLDKDELYTKIADKTKSEVWIKRQITREQYTELSSLKLPGIYFTSDSKRYYPFNNFLSQTLGFTSIDGEGIEGLEAKYNKYLKGVEGKLVTYTDKNGNEIAFGDDEYIEAADGADAVLTIDYVIQSFLERELSDALEINEAKSAQGIVMNPKTGEIYAIATKPDYDLNNPPRDNIETLTELARNRVITDAYEPGSTFKIVTVASGLDSGAITINSEFDDPGYKIIGKDRIKCWKRPPHGHQTLAEALQNSCNVAHMEIGLAMGVDTFYNYIYGFGFGDNTGIDYISDGSGIVRHKKYIREADLARIAFGQSIAVTPLQLANAACAAVNGGNLMEPHLVKSIVDADGNVIKDIGPTVIRKVISEQTSQTMRELLESVVTDGSGKNAYIPGYRVGGKTGTAQKYDDAGKVDQGKYIVSFIGFAPADDPQVLVLFLIDEPNVANAYGSVLAAPHVGNILEDTLKYLNVEPVYSEEDQELIKELVDVPDVAGMTLNEAAGVLQEAGLTYFASGEGKVLQQLPAAGTKVYKKSEVILYMEIQRDNDIGDDEGEPTVG
ncbi:MAG: penicillin-binding transpeptidase domain-containing protein [Christensenellales bacterium]